MPRDSSSVRLSWYVNTNEDVADFRVEVSSLADQKPRTLLVKDIAYNARYDVIKNVPGARGQELRMCLLVKNSLGRSLDLIWKYFLFSSCQKSQHLFLGNIRRWRQDQCQDIGPLYSSRATVTHPRLGLVTLMTALTWIYFKTCV